MQIQNDKCKLLLISIFISFPSHIRHAPPHFKVTGRLIRKLKYVILYWQSWAHNFSLSQYRLIRCQRCFLLKILTRPTPEYFPIYLKFYRRPIVFYIQIFEEPFLSSALTQTYGGTVCQLYQNLLTMCTYFCTFLICGLVAASGSNEAVQYSMCLKGQCHKIFKLYFFH